MARMWDLDDLVTQKQFAEEQILTMSAISNWRIRYDDFPVALIHSHRNAAYYSREELLDWLEEHRKKHKNARI
jgi:hypothetical protein